LQRVVPQEDREVNLHMKVVQVMFDEQYRRAYAGGSGRGEELEGWEDEGASSSAA
jgi:hypothetical protein